MARRLAACAEMMMFLGLPVTERVQRIAEAGFDAEIWDWTRHDVEALAATGPRGSPSRWPGTVGGFYPERGRLMSSCRRIAAVS